MKKTLLILTAAALLLTGCSKKSDSEPKPQEPIGVTTSAKEHTADTTLPQTSPTEPLFRDLNGDSFTPIKVNTIRQDLSQQLGVLSDVTFTPDFSTKELLSMESSAVADIISDGGLLARTEEGAYSLPLPQIMHIASDGETMYFIVNFDMFYSNLKINDTPHCFSIFKCSLSDGEMKELFSYSDSEYSWYPTGIRLFNNRIWIAVGELDDVVFKLSECKLMCIDLESGELVKELPIGNFDDFDDSPDRLVFHYWSDESQKHIYSEYIPETDTIEEIAEFTDSKVFFTNSGMVSDEVDDEGYCIVNGEDFRLETGLKGRLAAAGGRNITITRRNDDVIHTFNLEKMERYDIDLSGLGSDMIVTSDGNDLIVSSSGALYHYYLMPELGACWIIHTSQNQSKLYNTGDAFISFISDYTAKTLNIKKIKKPE